MKPIIINEMNIPDEVIQDAIARFEAERHVRVTAATFTATLADGEGYVIREAFRWDDVPFERIRRITGYLAKLTGWNAAKRAEEKDRVKHGMGGGK